MYSFFFRFPFTILLKGDDNLLDPKVVGRVIQKTREEKGLSQEVVSGLADIGRTHLSAIERGLRKPTMETFFKIANAMDIEASILLKQIESECGEITSAS